MPWLTKVQVPLEAQQAPLAGGAPRVTSSIFIEVSSPNPSWWTRKAMRTDWPAQGARSTMVCVQSAVTQVGKMVERLAVPAACWMQASCQSKVMESVVNFLLQKDSDPPPAGTLMDWYMAPSPRGSAPLSLPSRAENDPLWKSRLVATGAGKLDVTVQPVRLPLSN